MIHARSCFLQGLLLEKSNNWPPHISQRLRKHHSRTERIVFNNNISMLDLCLGYIRNLNFLDSIVVGFTNISELDDFFKSWYKKNNIPNSIDFNELSWDNIEDLDPRCW